MRVRQCRYATSHFGVSVCLCLTSLLAIPLRADAPNDERSRAEFFEKSVRPLFIERCVKCHGPDKQQGGLRLDQPQAALRGADSGPVILSGKPDESPLIAAVRQTGDVKMPPKEKLTDAQIASLVAWIKAGAVWPDVTASKPLPEPATSEILPLLPNDSSVASSLQIWLRADSLTLSDGSPVPVWPDQSGHGRDFSMTKGVRKDGTGEAPQFARESTIRRRPAVRFTSVSGMATSPDRPVAIRGDAELTMILVMNLEPNDANPPYDGVLGIGNPANPGSDPGRPLAALVQISRPRKHELQLAGGWNHDAGLGADSMQPLYRQPLLLSITKRPGPMRATTRFFLNGAAAEKSVPPRTVEGRDTVPDIQHRQDIGAYLGKAVSWAGSFRGDLAEAIIYNRVLTDAEREGVELSLAEKYGLILPSQLAQTTTRFTDEQRSYWAFQPVQDSKPPPLKSPVEIRSPIDGFVLAQLENKGLTPSQTADKRTLIRRVTFDLTGLPPSPAEIDAFLADDSPQEFANVVDRLLNSPHYGEHWGRHWLDVVRYAETTANDANAVMRFAYRYRDYVVDALNRDLPYDQFLVEQLAGDLLPRTDDHVQTTRQVIATGFLMIGPKALAETDKEQTRIDIVDEQLDVTSRAFLGLTLACARCHDHKFDPLPTTDYYALAGVFRSAEPLQDEARNNTMFQEYSLDFPGQSPLMVMAIKEGQPRDLRVHVRGNRFQLGRIVPRRLPLILTDGQPTPIETEQSGRLELARWIASPANPLTARVMVNRIWQHHFGAGLVATTDNFGTRGETPSHPKLLDWLAARFVENGWSIKAMHRLILNSATYQQAGAASPAALQIDPANRLLSHTSRRRLSAEELRDAMLVVNGQLDRKLGGGESAEILFKEAEVQDAKRGFAPNRMQSDHPFYNTPRRSLYLPVVRNALPDALALFDAADPNAVTSERNDTTVPSQSLYLLNSSFVRDQSQHLANRLLGTVQPDDAARIKHVSSLCFGRSASDPETVSALAFIEQIASELHRGGKSPDDSRRTAWQNLCQVLLCSNEFLYVE
ncbi:MAG: PSD1 domain-containing protein [Planctomycetales bacterium]|nr:PSD1 domain-containing protein [Planctomycetales bacterium]